MLTKLGMHIVYNKVASASGVISAVRSFIPRSLGAATASGGVAGVGAGAYLGNELYKSHIPPVKSLPYLEHEPEVDVPKAPKDYQLDRANAGMDMNNYIRM